MLHSMRVKLIALLVVFVMGTMTVSIVLNAFFLQKYYLSQKEDRFNKLYYTLNSIDNVEKYFKDGKNYAKIYKQCENDNISLAVMNNDGMTVFSIGSAFAKAYASGIITGNQKITDNSDRVSMTVDNNSGLYYLEMHGMLDKTNLYIMCASVENINNSVDISTRFFSYISMVSILCSGVFMWVVSKRFTRPILNLVAISEKMCDLDFNAKYVEDHYSDEIDTLGASMNNLSEKLETTIVDLKNANLQLQKDIDKKTEIDNMRKDFISNVSHELKTPIALIQGYAEGLKEGINDDDLESREFYCDVIMDEANRMNKLVRNLLSLNQLEHGSTPLEMSRFDIVSVVNGVLNASKLLIEQKEVKIIFDNTKEHMVYADEFQIEQVITNYITNAINHVNEEKIIRIDLEDCGNNLKIKVFNTGKNIPQDDIDKLWIKFYKVDKARTREYGGNGIGLSIVKAIMDLHNKPYGVYNASNGVVFWFEVDKKTEI